jgi:hypothetical protein
VSPKQIYVLRCDLPIVTPKLYAFRARLAFAGR